MRIISRPMGVYQTNCYILSSNGNDFIIDPGVDAFDWIQQNATNPVAILNTHGHFDHVWSNQEVKEFFNIPIYCPKEDAFLLQNDPLGQGTPPSSPDILVKPNETFTLHGVSFSFMHFPGHTPGCSMIRFDDHIFSGDFIFQDSIGRYDFPMSNANDMRHSLEAFLNLDFDATLYPGHGGTTTIKREQTNTPFWLKRL